MKVLKEGTALFPKFIGICPECACVVECEEGEIQQTPDGDHGGGVRIHVKCPNAKCRHEIDLQRFMRPEQ